MKSEDRVILNEVKNRIVCDVYLYNPCDVSDCVLNMTETVILNECEESQGFCNVFIIKDKIFCYRILFLVTIF